MDTNQFKKYDDGQYLKFINPSVVEKDLRSLVAILEGIRSDGHVNELENSKMYQWINNFKVYENKQPYKDIINTIRFSLNDGLLTEDEADNIVWFCNQYIEKNGYYTQITAGIQRLLGLMKGLAIDNEVNIIETKYLSDWLDQHDYLKNTYPYDEIYSLITKIEQDGIITEGERNDLLNFCSFFTNEANDSNNLNLVKGLNEGFFQIDPQIIIQEKTFCITGQSVKFKRKEIAEKIELYGGFITDSVTNTTNYLVVCDEKNDSWAFTCYGKKVEKAIKLRKNGQQISIIHEFDLYDELQSLGS